MNIVPCGGLWIRHFSIAITQSFETFKLSDFVSIEAFVRVGHLKLSTENPFQAIDHHVVGIGLKEF
ncbi:hypothetical protein D3C73_1514470 [compost metagenome]